MDWHKTLYEIVGAKHPLLSLMIASLVGAVFFGFLWHAVIGGEYRKKVAEAAAAASKPSPFSVDVRSAIISHPTPLTFYMVTYQSMYGPTVSPIFLLAYVQITNTGDVINTISDLKVDIGKGPDGPWEELVPIPLSRSQLITVGVQGARAGVNPRPIGMSRGTMYFGDTRTTTDDLKKSVVTLAHPPLEAALNNPIPPHTPIRGWLALDSRVHEGPAPEKAYLRFTLRDTTNNSGLFVAPLPALDRASMDVNNGVLQMTPVITDISGYKVRYYSDTYH